MREMRNLAHISPNVSKFVIKKTLNFIKFKLNLIMSNFDSNGFQIDLSNYSGSLDVLWI